MEQKCRYYCPKCGERMYETVRFLGCSACDEYFSRCDWDGRERAFPRHQIHRKAEAFRDYPEYGGND